ncbi:EthD family reductase [Roseicyclus mahoneyensis]|jgi:uncharacterized protein (TIGR02118 family)|uniref:Uncharacterized protein (TIGR02118 family) n=1 Tax=Roseicyclus mahoneyensis TaxID=164332 RepID=A0A316GLC3_9RHOB|nr:EthD family reductase [Roseicyclus mahoneyensis]PWK61487.1 uncharacterized protein (TIGR02118 family) [Roseicyclus mahoneyensis]
MTVYIHKVMPGETMRDYGSGLTDFVHCPSIVDQGPPQLDGFSIKEAEYIEGSEPFKRHKIIADRTATEGGVFLAAFVRRKPGLTMSEFTTYSLNVHAAMDAKMPGLGVYEQYHAIEEGASFDCLSLFHFQNMETLEAALGSDVVTAGTADLINFIDPAASLVLAAKRHNGPTVGTS